MQNKFINIWIFKTYLFTYYAFLRSIGSCVPQEAFGPVRTAGRRRRRRRSPRGATMGGLRGIQSNRRVVKKRRWPRRCREKWWVVAKMCVHERRDFDCRKTRYPQTVNELPTRIMHASQIYFVYIEIVYISTHIGIKSVSSDGFRRATRMRLARSLQAPL
jgi:hypothetical protein